VNTPTHTIRVRSSAAPQGRRHRWATSTSPSSSRPSSAHFLTNDAGIDVISNSYGDSGADNDGFDAASQKLPRSQIFGSRTTSVHSTGKRGAGLRHGQRATTVHGDRGRRRHPPGGTGWDLIKKASQIRDNDIIRGLTAGRRQPAMVASTSWATAPLGR
jgi:hypothetical protein